MGRPTLESVLLRPFIEWAGSYLAVADSWDVFCVSDDDTDNYREAQTNESLAWEKLMKCTESRRAEILAYVRQMRKS